MVGFFNTTARVTIPTNKTFSYSNEEHLRLIDARVARFNEAYSSLSMTHKCIFFGGLLATGAYIINCIPLIPFTMSAAMLGCLAFGFGLGRHSEVYKQYQEALADLIEAYNWAMGTRTGSSHWYNLRCSSIQKMILSLGPRVSSGTIATWEDSDLTSGYTPDSLWVKEKNSAPMTEDFKKKLNAFASGDQMNSWDYRIYGDGGVGDISFLMQAFKAYLQQYAPTVTKAVLPLIIPKQS